MICNKVKISKIKDINNLQRGLTNRIPSIISVKFIGIFEIPNIIG